MSGEIHKEELAVILDDDGGTEIDEEQGEKRASLLFLPEYPPHERTCEDSTDSNAPQAEVLVERVETGVGIGERRFTDER